MYDGQSPWLAVDAAFIFAYITAALILFIRLRLKTMSPLLKKQSPILAVTIIVSMAVFFAVTYLPVLLRTGSVSFLDLSTMLIWQIGLSFAVSRYGFMVISPESASASILRTMADGLLLLDGDGTIIGSNQSLLEMLETREKEIVGGAVETEGQLETLRSMRWDFPTELICDSVRGYLFSRPLPPEALAPLLPRNPH